MPWRTVSTMDMKLEFIKRAGCPGVHFGQLCQSYGISRQWGYTLLKRHQAEGDQGLLPQGRQPHTSPQATPDAIVQQILELRKQHPRWGGRKIRQWLIQHGQVDMPSEKTINRILKRQGCINPEESAKHRPLIRFEHAHPND